MLILFWALALLSVASSTSTLSTPSFNSNNTKQALSSLSSSGNVGTSKTFPLKASQKITKRELRIRDATLVPIDKALSGKLAVDPSANITTGSEGSALVEQDGHDISYYVEVHLGTDDKQTYNLVVDTGSFYTWVYGLSCTSDDCAAHNRFDASKSSISSQQEDNEFSIVYTSGSVQGKVVNDLFSFAGFKSPQMFGLASVVDTSFANFPIDGILGLPAKDKSPQDFPGIVSTLADQQLIDTRVIGINLGRDADPLDQGSLTIGGIDDSKYSGNINYISLVDDSGLFWEIPVGATYLNGYPIDFGGSRTAIVDTGTTLLVMSPDDALKLHGYISGTQTDGTNFVIPCNTSMQLEFEFNNIKYLVSPQDYVGVPYSEPDAETPALCISNIQGIQFENNRWILGDVFLKNVYSVYNMETHQVGFANKTIGSTNVTPDGSFVYSESAKAADTTESNSTDTSSSQSSSQSSSHSQANVSPPTSASYSPPSQSTTHAVEATSASSLLSANLLLLCSSFLLFFTCYMH